MDDYFFQNIVAWSIRCMLAFSIVALIAAMGGCTHELKSTVDSVGSWKRDLPSVVQPAN